LKKEKLYKVDEETLEELANEEIVIKREQRWLNIARIAAIVCRLVLGTILVIGLLKGYKQATLVSALGLLIVQVQVIIGKMNVL